MGTGRTLVVAAIVMVLIGLPWLRLATLGLEALPAADMLERRIIHVRIPITASRLASAAISLRLRLLGRWHS